MPHEVEQHQSPDMRWLRVHRPWSKSPLRRGPWLLRTTLTLGIGFLAIMLVLLQRIDLCHANNSASGAIQVIDYTYNTFNAQFPYYFQQLERVSGFTPNTIPAAFSRWPSDTTGDIQPVNCHSHNDYFRAVPLYDALYAGCRGVEADVWHTHDDLFVGHRRSALTANRTLESLYLHPLMDLMEKQNPDIQYGPKRDYLTDRYSSQALNGIYDTDPSQTLVLLIDFKTSGPPLWSKLNQQLEPLRERGYLTHYNGTAVITRPITIVGTGNAPFNLLTRNESYRDIFFDAPLEAMADTSSLWLNPNVEQDPGRRFPLGRYAMSNKSSAEFSARSKLGDPNHDLSPSSSYDLGQGKSGTTQSTIYNTTNSYYASVSFSHSVGRIWGSRLSQAQLQIIRSQVRGAHQKGLKVR